MAGLRVIVLKLHSALIDCCIELFCIIREQVFGKEKQEVLWLTT